MPWKHVGWNKCWTKTEKITKEPRALYFGAEKFEWADLAPVKLGSNSKALGSIWFWMEMVPKWERISTKMKKVQILVSKNRIHRK